MHAVDEVSGLQRVLGVVIVLSSWLHQVERQTRAQVRNVVASHNRPNDQDYEDNEHDEVQHGVTDNTSLAKSRLLERVDWWSNLTASES